MTPPVSNAVQGAFVVAAVCTGAALGGLAVLFKDLAECLGCLLGGVALSMWLLTLRPGGLVQNSTAKVVFITVFGAGAFCLYFSHWTRMYGLMACIAFSGATAAVLGIDCFSRAGLKEFWAYIWELNDKLFPDGADTYPLTRGIKVELAVIILIFIVSIVSQLRLWRLIRDRRNKKSKDESSDEEPALPDEEENVGRLLEEATKRERREWERRYGNGGSVSPESPDSGVSDMESKRASATTTTEVVSPGDLPVKIDAEQGIIEKDPEDGRVTVRVVDDDRPAADGADHAVHETDEDVLGASAASATKGSSQAGSEPAIVPLPFKVPTPKKKGDSASINVSEEDRSSVAAVADDEEQGPGVLSQAADVENVARMAGHSGHTQGRLSQCSSGDVSRDDVAGGRYEALMFASRMTREDTDSVVATLDDASTSGDADTADLDWSPPEERLKDGAEGENKKGVETGEQTSSEPTTGEVEGDVAVPRVPEDPHQPTLTEPTTPSAGEPAEGTNLDDHKQKEVAADNTARTAGDPSLNDHESTASLRTTVARLTKLNLPPALSDVALTYRTNEWAKHLSIAETPVPEALQTTQPPLDAPVEEPAYLDIVELQKSATNGAPPPAAPKASGSKAHHGHQRSNSKASLSSSETTGFTPPESVSGHKPAPYRSASMMMKRRSSAVLAEPIAEEDGEARGLPGAHSADASLPTPDLATQPKTQTLIGMREKLLRSRASGIVTPYSNDPSDLSLATTTPTTTVTTPSSSSDIDLPLDLDDLPLSQRLSILRQSTTGSLPAAVTAETTPFNSHQPQRGSTPSNSTVRPDAVRQAQLARFRNSVAADLREAALPPAIVGGVVVGGNGAGGARRLSGSSATIFAGQGMGIGGSASLSSLHLAGSSGNVPGAGMWMAGYPVAPAAGAAPGLYPATATTGYAAVPMGGGYEAFGFGGGEERGGALRSMEMQRSIMMGQMDAEAQRRMMEKMGKKRFEREFEERMRSGELLGVHRDAMKKLQGSVKG